MKHIFLINPAAGKKGNSESIIRPQIEDYCGKNGLDYEIYVTGIPVELDVVKCGDKIAINQCSMGMDAEVCAKQSSFKKLPLVNGEMAYFLAAIEALFKKLGHNFTIKIDDNEPFEDNVLFCVAGNSRWYGGGFMAAPLAWPDDGKLDFVIVRLDRGRLRLAPLLQKYKKGQHLGLPMIVPKAIKFVVPQFSEFHKGRAEREAARK